MELDALISAVPLPAMLGVVLYVNYRLKDHEKSCSMRDLLELLIKRQQNMDEKMDRIIDYLIK